MQDDASHVRCTGARDHDPGAVHQAHPVRVSAREAVKASVRRLMMPPAAAVRSRQVRRHELRQCLQYPLHADNVAQRSVAVMPAA